MLNVRIEPKAGRTLKKIRKQDKHFYKQIRDAVDAIRHDPSIGESKKGDLVGYQSLDLYNKGINYELAYRLEEDGNGKLVVIIMFGSRENFYEELKRYLKVRK
ncbi:type II toxin-antitoxin system RelE/ParE family toxin [Sporolactobacillus nakayamae]|uniref:ParE-like toxin of type II toxin-antitoxin system n=1 Tax=Sporolactobacillus nakayamae TaxID=269670 RepID=A0A1I2VSH1_9BACL|nr:type II toxin-antitoxin system RelE/ParE family toxin [Sporolactobacillus nakayamae]SFG90456.1 ParE-like toxin of type II toxin-antitoxin system [Sporolactobacillus nakayamae]